MASLNKAIVIGNLGKDPEIRYTAGGQAVANMTIATNERWTDKEGAKQERTEWHRIVVWGRQAENCNQYLKKGRQVYVEGRIQTREWEDKEGQKRYTTEIVASNVLFLSGEANMGGGGGDYGGGGGGDYNSGGGGGGGAKSGGGFDDSFNEDDIPF